MNNIQPRAGDNIKDFTAVNMWYERMNQKYNFSVGPVLFPLLTSDNLEQIAKLDPPYLKGYTDKIKGNNMFTIFGKTSMF